MIMSIYYFPEMPEDYTAPSIAQVAQRFGIYFFPKHIEVYTCYWPELWALKEQVES